MQNICVLFYLKLKYKFKYICLGTTLKSGKKNIFIRNIMAIKTKPVTHTNTECYMFRQFAGTHEYSNLLDCQNISTNT